LSDIVKFIDMDWKNGVLFIAALVVVAVFLIQKWDWVISRFGIVSKRRLAYEKLGKDVDELKDHTKKTDENIEKLMGTVNEMKECIYDLSNKVNDMQKKNDENEVARIGDRLTQAYNFYRKRGSWTNMEKWAFDNMVKQYKSSGGDSWIDEVAVPASRGWEIVDE